MRDSFDFLWVLFTVSPVVVLSIRTGAARRKSKRSDEAWKLVERYIA
jgi:hypothetical protein